MTTLLAFDIDGTLIDTRPSFDRIIRELSPATDEDIAVFRRHGGFNDDWELTRAAVSWIGAGRPAVLERCDNVHDVIAWCGHDPGDLAEQCIARYRGGYWRDERLLIDGSHLARLAARFAVAACTGRDRWELARAEELLGFTFPQATTAEDVRKPAAAALLRLIDDGAGIDEVLLLGDTGADRRTCQAARTARPDLRIFYVHVTAENPAQRLIDGLLEGHHVADLAARLGEA